MKLKIWLLRVVLVLFFRSFDKKFRSPRNASSNRCTVCKVRAYRTRFIVFRRGILNRFYFRLHAYWPRRLWYLSSTSTRRKFISASRYSAILFLSVVRIYVLLRTCTCVCSLCRLTFINYCLRRGRMRSHKSNRALFVSLSAMYMRAGKCYTLYMFDSIYFLHCTPLYISYIPKSCAILS